MAIATVVASSEWIRYATTPIQSVSEPFTMAAFGYTTVASANGECLMQLSDEGVDGNYWRVGIDSSNYAMRGRVDGDTSAFDVEAATGLTQNEWFHVAVVFTDSNNRTIYFNGSGTSDVGNHGGQPSNIDVLSVCAEDDGGVAGYWPGGILWPALWNVGLTASEASDLNAGIPPWKIRPDQLIFFAPLERPEATRDWISGTAGSITGTPDYVGSPHVSGFGSSPEILQAVKTAAGPPVPPFILTAVFG